MQTKSTAEATTTDKAETIRATALAAKAAGGKLARLVRGHHIIGQLADLRCQFGLRSECRKGFDGGHGRADIT